MYGRLVIDRSVLKIEIYFGRRVFSKLVIDDVSIACSSFA